MEVKQNMSPNIVDMARHAQALRKERKEVNMERRALSIKAHDLKIEGRKAREILNTEGVTQLLAEKASKYGGIYFTSDFKCTAGYRRKPFADLLPNEVEWYKCADKLDEALRDMIKAKRELLRTYSQNPSIHRNVDVSINLDKFNY
jgi:hypothetical protein